MNPNHLLPLSDTWALPRPLAIGLLGTTKAQACTRDKNATVAAPTSATVANNDNDARHAPPCLWRQSLAEAEAARLPLWITCAGFLLFGALVASALAVTVSETARLVDPAGLDFAVKALLR